MRTSPQAKGLLRLSGALTFLAVSFTGNTALSQEFEGQIALSSEYVGKGLGKSDGQPSLSGSAQISTGDVYASVFASSADLAQGAHAEIVTAIGYRPEVAGFGLDLSVINRDLPGTRSGVDSNYMEYQADVSRDFGPVGARLRVNYTPDGFAATREAWWIELQGGVSLDARTKATAAVAERLAEGGAEYTAWNLGVKRKLTRQLALDVRWFDTNEHSFGPAYDGRLVGALSFSF